MIKTIDKKERMSGLRLAMLSPDFRVPCFSIVLIFALSLLCLVGMLFLGTGCTKSSETSSSSDTSTNTDSIVSTNVPDQYYQNISLTDVGDMDFTFSDRDNSGTYDNTKAQTLDVSNLSQIKENGVSVTDKVLTINKEGTYVLTGNLSDGQVVVEVSKEEKVQLVLQNLSLTNNTGAAIYIKQADKVFVTLAEGTTNTLSDGTDYRFESTETDEPDAVLFSADDLCLNGSGTLNINANYKHALKSKNDLKITGGTYVVSAVQDALRGKDCVKISGGKFTLNAGGDGIQSSNVTEEGRGFVYISGGDFEITAGDDAIQAVMRLGIAGGTYKIAASDDALHADRQLIVDNGSFAVNAGDDAFHGETSVVINAGDVYVESCYEGLEAEKVYVDSGTVVVNASDDGINASTAFATSSSEAAPGAAQGGTDGKGGQTDSVDPGAQAGNNAQGGAGATGAQGGGNTSGSQGGQDMQAPQGGFQGGQSGDMTPPDLPQGGSNPSEEGFLGGTNESQQNQGKPDGGMVDGGTAMMGDENCFIQINGGTVMLNTSGDSIDSNGSVEITGGTLLVSGPVSGADSAFDYDISATISGGTVLMVGSAEMAQNFTSGTQPFIFSKTSGTAGQSVAITDEQGNVLVSFTSPKNFEVVQASVSSMKEGSNYNIVIGGSVSGADANGFATSGTVDGGSSVSVSASTTASGGFGGLNQQGNPMDAGTKGQGGGKGK